MIAFSAYTRYFVQILKYHCRRSDWIEVVRARPLEFKRRRNDQLLQIPTSRTDSSWPDLSPTGPDAGRGCGCCACWPRDPNSSASRRHLPASANHVALSSSRCAQSARAKHCPARSRYVCASGCDTTSYPTPEDRANWSHAWGESTPPGLAACFPAGKVFHCRDYARGPFKAS